jgi:hypothetical protein
VRIPYDRNCKTSTRRSEGLAVEHGIRAQATERERPSQVDLVEPDIDHQNTHKTRSLANNACPAGEFAKGDPTQPFPISGCKHCPAGRYSDKPAATVHFVSQFADVCLVWFCTSQHAIAYDVIVCNLCMNRRVSRVQPDLQTIRTPQLRFPTAVYNNKMLGSIMIVPKRCSITLV